MAGQTVARREVIRLLGIASVAATFPGFRQWAFAAGPAPAAASGPGAAALAYQPLFFNPGHYRLVEQLAELIIPEDDTPGASAGWGRGIHRLHGREPRADQRRRP